MPLKASVLGGAFVHQDGSYAEVRPALLNERRVGEIRTDLIPVVFIYGGAGTELKSESEILAELDKKGEISSERAAAFRHALTLIESMEQHPGNFPVIHSLRDMHKQADALDPFNQPEKKPALDAPKQGKGMDKSHLPQKPSPM